MNDARTRPFADAPYLAVELPLRKLARVVAGHRVGRRQRNARAAWSEHGFGLQQRCGEDEQLLPLLRSARASDLAAWVVLDRLPPEPE